MGLERVSLLMERLGSPQRGLRFVHIAGTNGKGSIAAMLSLVLEKSGYRTGLFTSPALNGFNERMTVDGREISDGEIVSVAGRVKQAVFESVSEGFEMPSEFEFVTAMAFTWFFERGCDVVVLETGLGGRLDATNIIDRPEAAVISAIGLDHTAELGGTLPLIAAEKAAIIKSGCAAVSYPQEPEAQAVIEGRCAAVGVRLTVPDFSRIRQMTSGFDGQSFDYGAERALFVSLPGSHQLKNAAVVIETVYRLRDRGFRVPDAALREGLSRARWPGRLELLRNNPPVVLDGAHNGHGAKALAGALTALFPGQRIIFVAGILEDKDFSEMLSVTSPLAMCYITVTPPSPRAMSAGRLAEAARYFCGDVTAGGGIEASLELALERQARSGAPVCCFGSLYMAGAVREYIINGGRSN